MLNDDEKQVTETLLGEKPQESEDLHEEDQTLTPEEKDFREFLGVDEKTKPDPAWDNKRFRSIYRKSKDLERKLSEKDSDIELMRKHNQALFESVNKVTETASTLIESETDRRATIEKNELQNIENRIETLKTDRAKARKEGDWDEVDRLESQIDKAKDTLQEKRLKIVESAKETPQKRSAPDAEMDAVNTWASSTPWFSYESSDFNPVMTAAAKEYDTYLMQRPEWRNKPIAERLGAVRSKIEDDFSWGKSKKDNGRKVGGSEMPSRESPPTQPEKGELDDEQKRVARRMFPDKAFADAEKIYSQQLKIINQRRV